MGIETILNGYTSDFVNIYNTNSYIKIVSQFTAAEYGMYFGAYDADDNLHKIFEYNERVDAGTEILIPGEVIYFKLKELNSKYGMIHAQDTPIPPRPTPGHLIIESNIFNSGMTSTCKFITNNINEGMSNASVNVQSGKAILYNTPGYCNYAFNDGIKYTTSIEILYNGAYYTFSLNDYVKNNILDGLNQYIS